MSSVLKRLGLQVEKAREPDDVIWHCAGAGHLATEARLTMGEARAAYEVRAALRLRKGRKRERRREIAIVCCWKDDTYRADLTYVGPRKSLREAVDPNNCPLSCSSSLRQSCSCWGGWWRKWRGAFVSWERRPRGCSLHQLADAAAPSSTGRVGLALNTRSLTRETRLQTTDRSPG